MIKRFRYDFKSGIVADGKGDFISYAEYEALQQKLAAVTEQRDALVVEMAALNSGDCFFSYGSERGFEWHKTAKEAAENAEAAIDDYRGDACDGWSEEVISICWGVIMQSSTMVGERSRTEDDCVDSAIDTICDYALLPAIETPATSSAIAALRAEGVEMLLTEKFKAEIAGALADFDGVDDATLQTLIWSGQPPEPDGDVWHIEYMTRGYQVQKKIREFARQLRDSKGATHG